MKKIIISSLIILLAISGFGQNQKKTLSISGEKAWTNTEINVKIGDKIKINAEGIVMPNGSVKSDANGVPNRPDWQENYSVLKTSNHVCLIGKIGKNGKPFFVGKNSTIIAQSNGILFLGINDTDLGNNSGEFIVEIIKN